MAPEPGHPAQMPPRRKELRIALVCYGGISLAVYMHGVTKEAWKLARASALPADALRPSEKIYADLLARLAGRAEMQLCVLPDIVAGASAGGLNAVFLAQAIHTGQSLEPLTRLWLDHADIEHLLATTTPGWRSFAKQWAAPLVAMALGGRSGADEPGARKGLRRKADPVSPAEREVRAKLAKLVGSPWFEAPFSGIGLSRLIAGALDAMAETGTGAETGSGSLLPAGHPLDLFTTATDCVGHTQRVVLHSPSFVEEREHRVPIGFHAVAGSGTPTLAPLPELVFAARATSSFPGAFPPLLPGEIDTLMAERHQPWPERDAFLRRILPDHAAAGTIEEAALMDGSVLVNAPFAQAIAALPLRPAKTEVDRRLIYIDPTAERGTTAPAPGFFGVIFRALSTIPREQPIHDNLETLARQSAALARAGRVAKGLGEAIEQSVRRALGEAILGARPDARQLGAWRRAAQDAAAQEAGYAYQAYALVRLEATLDTLARRIAAAAPTLDPIAIRDSLGRWAEANLRPAPTEGCGLSSELAQFLDDHDTAFRQRRLRHAIARLNAAREEPGGLAPADTATAREAAWRALSLALETQPLEIEEPERVLEAPGCLLREIAVADGLPGLDAQVEAVLAQAMGRLADRAARVLLMAWLGFGFHDAATLALTRDNGLAETSPVQIDRISPLDARSHQGQTAGEPEGIGLARRLKGEEFHQFGAFFSRAYREHDYLLGRLHGAARLVEITASAGPVPLEEAELGALKRALLAAILDEEEPLLRADPTLVPNLRAELGLQP